MKKTFLIPCLAVILFACNTAPENSQTEKFKVWGNCGMCKKTIEGSLKKQDGIFNADWDKDSKMIEVVYDPKKMNRQKIDSSIASVGYDTENMRGNDTAYAQLHECCQYERK